MASSNRFQDVRLSGYVEYIAFRGLYAAAMLPETGYERISKICSNDGPGLCPDIISINNQKRLQEKLVRIIPDFSTIGGRSIGA